MTLAARDLRRGRPRLRVVGGAQYTPADRSTWQRAAAAVLACTHELAGHLLEQRWGRVDEVMRERRELLAEMARLKLDVDGRRCLLSLEQAALESEQAILAMMGSAGPSY
jgi:hypothetical protein